MIQEPAESFGAKYDKSNIKNSHYDRKLTILMHNFEVWYAKVDFSDRFEEPILNKQILQALINHAQQIAKLALEANGAGRDLVKDVKVI